jgi:hypothetical protein
MTGKIEWLRGKDQAWVEPERNPQLQLQVPLRLEEENQEHIREENRTLRCRRCPVKLSMLRCKTGSLSGVRAPLSKSSHVFVAGHGVIGRTHTTINSAEFCVWRQPSLVRMLQAQELDMGLVFPASVPHPKPSSGAYSSHWMKSHFPMSWWEALGFGPQGRHFTVFLSYCAVLEMCYIITRGFVVISYQTMPYMGDSHLPTVTVQKGSCHCCSPQAVFNHQCVTIPSSPAQILTCL